MKKFFMLISPFLLSFILFGLLFKYLRDDDPKVAKQITYTIPIEEEKIIEKEEEETYIWKQARDFIPSYSKNDDALGGFKSEGFFQGGRDVMGLSIHSIRWSRHDGYERLVFDISDDQSRYLSDVGKYNVGTEDEDSTSIAGEFLGCNLIIGISPNFAGSDIVSELELSSDTSDGCSFSISLQKPSTYKVFTLPNPARLIIDFRF